MTYTDRFKEWVRMRAVRLELKGIYPALSQLLLLWMADPNRRAAGQTLDDFLAVTADRLDEAARAIRRVLGRA